MDTHLLDYGADDSLKEFRWKWNRKKYRTGNACLFHRETRDYVYLYMWMTFEWQERSRIRLPCGINLMKDADLDEPTSFLDHVFLGCTQRECKPNEDIVEQYKEMFESRVSAGATEMLPG